MGFDTIEINLVLDTVNNGATMVTKLPCRMNYRQCLDWIRNQILANHIEQRRSGVMKNGNQTELVKFFLGLR